MVQTVHTSQDGFHLHHKHLSYALIFVPLHFVILSTVHSLLMHICHGLVQYIVFKLKGFHARMDLYNLMLIISYKFNNSILQHEILQQRTEIAQMKSATYSGNQITKNEPKSDDGMTYLQFLTALLLRGLRNDFFFQFLQFTFSNYYLDFYFPFLFGLLFPLFLCTFIFPFLFEHLFPFSLWTFTQSRSHFGLLPFFFIYRISSYNFRP